MDNDLPRLSRLSSILILLQSKRILTATEIAKKFEISKRTVYRDIKALEQSGVPIFVEEGKGYSLIEGYNMPPIMFTEEEANALITAEKFIALNSDNSLVQNYQSAIEKVKAILQYTSKDKVELLSERIGHSKPLINETKSDSLSFLQTAITDRKTIEIKYNSLYKEEYTSRIVESQALYHANGNWIMIAWCQLRNDYREFRLDRILDIKFLNSYFENRNFNLADYFFKVSQQNSEHP